jgi:hypothetical protein
MWAPSPGTFRAIVSGRRRPSAMANSPDMFNDSKIKLFSFFICFWRTSGSFFVIFSSVALLRDQPAAKCHPRWQPTRRLAVSCGVWRRRIRTRDCRTTVWRSTIEIKLLICNPRVPAVLDEDEVLATTAQARSSRQWLTPEQWAPP